VHHRDERRGFTKTTVGTPSFLPPPVTRTRSPGPSIAVVCAEKLVFGSVHTFAFSRPITIVPAPPFSVCVIFPRSIPFGTRLSSVVRFDPRQLVDLVCVSPRVVSTRFYLDIVDLVVTFAALRPYAPFIAPVDWWTVILCHHRARISRTRFCAC
jgi:hypothetical protein